MKKYVSYLLTALAAFTLGFVFKFVFLGCGFLGYAMFAAGCAALFFLVLRILEPKYPKTVRRVNKTACYALWILLFCLVVTVTVIALDGKEGKIENAPDADYAVVLGAGVYGRTPSASLAARLNSAIEYAAENPETVFIVSGGQGSGELITEAQCMFDYMTARGVAPERVLMEPRATDTEENLAFSREIILSRDPGFDGRILIVTESYHITRARLFAEKAGFERVTAVGAYNGHPLVTANYYLREAVALWYFLIFVK